MDRLVIWMILAVVYGGILALAIQFLGSWGVLVWLAVVFLVQLWLKRRAENY